LGFDGGCVAASIADTKSDDVFVDESVSVACVPSALLGPPPLEIALGRIDVAADPEEGS
jgi:hypothetical protein